LPLLKGNAPGREGSDPNHQRSSPTWEEKPARAGKMWHGIVHP